MFCRVPALASRLAFVLLIILIALYSLLHTNRLSLRDGDIASIIAGFNGFSNEHLQYFFSSSGEWEDSHHQRVLGFWAKLEALLCSVDPEIETVKPIEKHKQQSFEEEWPHIIHEELISLRDHSFARLQNSHTDMVKKMRNLTTETPYVRGSRGVVMTAGERYVNAMLVSLRLLRKAGSKLPVEVFFDQRSEMTEQFCGDILADLHAECLYFEDIWSANVMEPKASRRLQSYQIKVFALLFSSFEDILFLDADAFPVRSPDSLLQNEPFSTYGLVTWPDFWATSTSPTFWHVTVISETAYGEAQNARASTESGILLVSKAWHASTLLLAAYYNYYGPGCYYPLLSQGAQGEGDKETFLHAATALGAPFYSVHTPVHVLGNFFDGRWESSGMKQADPEDDFKHFRANIVNATSSPLFIHHNNIKLDPEKLFDHPLLKEDANGSTVGRLWGSKESTVKQFRKDLEKQMWEEVTAVACKIGGNICEKAEVRLQSVYSV